MPDALEAAPVAKEPTAPAEVAKVEAEKGEIKEAPKEADKPEVKEGEGTPKPELTEVEKVAQAMQKRIDRQTAANKAIEERARRLEQQVQELSAKAPKADEAPKQEDFDDYDKWQEAVIEYRAKQKADETLKAEKEKELQATQAQQALEVKRQFDEKEKAFRTQTPDYDRVTGEAIETMTTLAQAGHNIGPLRDVVMQFDNPPELIYQLGKDTSLLEDLVQMPPLKVMRELVKLEATFKGAAKAEPPQAPEPIKSVGGKGGVKPVHERSAKDVLAWVKSK